MNMIQAAAACMAKKKNALPPSTLNDGLLHYYAEGTDLKGSTDLVATGVPSSETAKIGGGTCMGLDGTTNYSIADLDAGDFEGNQDVTFSFWFNPNLFATYPRVFGKDVGTNYRCYLDLSGYLTSNWGGRNVTHAVANVVGTWSLGVVSWTQVGGTLSVMVNDNTPTTSAGGTGTSNGHPFYIGNDSGSNPGFNGEIDQFCVWHRALTSGELTELYNGGSGTNFLA